MKLLSKYVNQNSLKQYYNSYILPAFDFGCVVWGYTTKNNFDRLVRLQKRAARLILKADFLTPSEELFRELKWLTFPKRVQYHTCLMVYKGIFPQCSLTSLNTTRGAPGLQPPIHCIFQDRTRLTKIRRFRSKVQNYGIIYHQTS